MIRVTTILDRGIKELYHLYQNDKQNQSFDDSVSSINGVCGTNKRRQGEVGPVLY